MLGRKRKKKDTGTQVSYGFPLPEDIVDQVNKRILREVEPMTITSVAKKLIELWVNKELYDENGNLL